ncbi:MAG: enoyl-CoA hydratase [Cognaticolwellia sp.]|jgi:enoyl-CoA hydratase
MSLSVEHLSLSTGGATRILLNRPKKANAYTREMLDSLSLAIAACTDPVLILGAVGKGVFCAGADLKSMGGATAEDALDLRSQRVFEQLATFPGVSIAAIDGAAVAGGLELTLACDLRVAGPLAIFRLPETGLGLIPAAGGCSRLPGVIGLGRAKEMVLLGTTLSAVNALDWGLVNAVHAEPMTLALEWAERVAERDPIALRLAKSVLNPALAESLERERLSEAILYARKEQK